MLNKIVRIYLVTGEVIIGRQMENSDNVNIVIDKPIQITAIPVAPGQFHPALSPYGSVFGALPPIEILSLTKDKILTGPLHDVPEQLVEVYIKATTGIELAKAPLVSNLN